MAEHPNVELMRKGYAAFAAGDMATVGELFADGIKWHMGGRNLLSGDYEGKEAAFGVLAKIMELAAGNFGMDIHDLLANDEHAVVLVTAKGQRPDGRTLEGRIVHVWHVSEGKATEFWAYPEDQAAGDAFWS